MSVNSVLGYAVYSRLSSSNDDSWTDRLNHLYTVLLLVIFTLVVASKQLVGDPIQCFVPAEFKPYHNAYVLAHCWTHNTYYVSIETEIPKSIEERGAAELAYYQWVTIILLFMALLFKLPYVLWRSLSGATGFNVSNYVTLAVKTQFGPIDKHDENMRHMSDHLDKWLRFNKKVVMMPQGNCRCDAETFRMNADGGKRWFIILLYFFVKFLYCVNALTQFLLLDKFLGGLLNMYGSNLIYKLSAGEVWEQSPRFPLYTLCDLEIRELQNVLNYTIQCVLPINLFNEKIFLYLWFWLIFVTVMSIISLCRWFCFMIRQWQRITFIVDYLRQINVLYGERDKSYAKKFVLDHLKGDGIFVLKMLEINTGAVVTADIIKQLWCLYRVKADPATELTAF